MSLHRNFLRPGVRLSQFMLLALAIGLLPVPTLRAEIEKIASVCEEGICPRWWPKVDPPSGWQHDDEASFRYNFNALVPKGGSFDEAVTVMYANAVYKPRVPELKTLDQFIKDDQAGLLKQWPDTSIRRTGPLQTGDGRTAQSWQIDPKTEGSWERIAYLEEGEYFLVFVASSRTPEGLKAAEPAFESMLSNYKE